LRSGEINELPLDDTFGFSNHYERSKWISENTLLTHYNDLPWSVFRVATVIADDVNGKVTQYNAFHNTLKLFFYGLLSVVPGLPDTPLYFVTGEFATKAIFETLAANGHQTIYHVAHTRIESPVLHELIDTAFDTFETDRHFKNRRVMKPVFCDAEAFTVLADGLNTFGSSILNQAVSSVAPFSKQLFIEKDVTNHRLVSKLSNYQAPTVQPFLENTCRYLASTKWGKES
jgi:hypothetical protein